MGDMRGKNVLEIACGSGDSLVWLGEKGAKELWGLDISSAQIKRADALLKKSGKRQIYLYHQWNWTQDYHIATLTWYFLFMVLDGLWI